MAYITGPAIGPVGRAHVHKVPCCAPCGRGRSCDSHKPLSGLTDRPLVLLAGAGLIAYLVLRRRRNPGKDWYVYSKERGEKRAEFTHGPYTEGVARSRLAKERTMGLVATMRRKR